MAYIGKTPTPQPLTATDIPDLPATKITSGTFPALNGSNLTNLDAADLTGTLPAISGANLTGIDASKLVLVGGDQGADNVSALNFDSVFSTTYRFYKAFHHITPGSTNTYLDFGLRASSSTIDMGSSWDRAFEVIEADSSESTITGSQSTTRRITPPSDSHPSYGGMCFELTFYNPFGTDGNYNEEFGTVVTSIFGISADTGASPSRVLYAGHGAFRHNDKDTHADGYRLTISAGNIENHRVRIYGLKES